MTFYSRDAEYACAVDGHCLVVLKSDQETYADRLTARVAELDAELDLILKAVQWANAENDKLKSELAAEKEENDVLNDRLNQLAAQGMEKMGFRPEGADDGK